MSENNSRLDESIFAIEHLLISVDLQGYITFT